MTQTMTNLCDWTTDDLINGLWSAEIYTRCQSAYELGRRKDTENLKIMLAVDVNTTSGFVTDPLTVEQIRRTHKTRHTLINQAYDTPESLLQTIFEHGDENMRCMTLCAAAGLGKTGHSVLDVISQYTWTRDAYLVIALEVCPPATTAVFMDYIYARLGASRWSNGFITLLYKRGMFGIQMLLLALTMGDATRRLTIMNGLESCQGWAWHANLVYGVAQCLYDEDLKVAKAAIKLLRHARVAQAVPYLSPFLSHKTLGKPVQGALRIIDTAEARQAIEIWQTS